MCVVRGGEGGTGSPSPTTTCRRRRRRGPRTGPARTSSASATPRDEPGPARHGRHGYCQRSRAALNTGCARPGGRWAAVTRATDSDAAGRLTRMLPPVARCLMRWCGRAWPRPCAQDALHRGHVRADEGRVYRLVKGAFSESPTLGGIHSPPPALVSTRPLPGRQTCFGGTDTAIG